MGNLVPVRTTAKLREAANEPGSESNPERVIRSFQDHGCVMRLDASSCGSNSACSRPPWTTALPTGRACWTVGVARRYGN